MKKYLLTFLFLGFIFLALPAAAQAATKCWDGGGTTNNWSEAANWAGDTLPTSTSNVTFHGVSCTAGTPDKDMVIDSITTQPDGTGGGMTINSDYSGTITQSNGVNLELGTLGFSQAGGTYVGGTGNITTNNGGFSLTGGTFTASSNTLLVDAHETPINVALTGGTFNHNDGLFEISIGGGNGAQATLTGTATFYDLELGSYCNNWNLFVLSSNTYTVNHTLTLHGQDSSNCEGYFSGSGVINAKGDITVTGVGNGGNENTANLIINGDGDQTITGESDDDTFIPNLTISKTSGTLNFVDTILNYGDWHNNNLGGTLNFGTSTVIIGLSSNSDPGATLAGSTTFYNLTISAWPNNPSAFTLSSGTTFTTTGTFTIDGTTNFQDINGPGTLNLQGDFSVTGATNYSGGDVPITFSGSANQNVTISSSTLPAGTITFNKSGGTITLATAWNLNNSGQDLLVAASSTQTLTGAFQLTVNDVTTISGTLTQGTATIQSGTFTIGSSGVWNNSSTGDIKVGSGGIGNSGAIVFTGSTGCGVSDAISITSTSGGAARTWSGSGGFYLTDLSLQDQTTSLGLTAYSSTSVSGNSGFTFDANCPVATAHWKFDEGYGTIAYDSVLNQADGTLSGSTLPAWKTEDMCISGKCLYFDGTTSYISVPSTFPAVKSVSLWVKPNSVTSGALIDLNNGTQNVTVSSGTLSASGFSSPTIYVNGVKSTTLVANAWNYVEVTTSTPINVGLVHIGKSSSTFMQGFIDDVKIFDSQRTASQVKSGYLSPGIYGDTAVSIAEPNLKSLSEGLVGYWNMNETSGNISDSSGNGVTASNRNTTAFVGGKFGKASDLESGSSNYFREGVDATLSTVGSDSGSGTGSAPTVTLPGGVTTGDLIIIGAAADDNISISISGYSEIPSSPGVDTGDFVKLATFYKVAGSSESNPTISYGASTGYRWIVYVVRGAHPTNPIYDDGETIDSAFSNTQAMPTLNADGNTVWSAVFSVCEGACLFSSWPSGWTTLEEANLGGFAVLVLGTNNTPGTGSIGGGTITETNNKNSVVHHVLIQADTAVSPSTVLNGTTGVSVSSWIKPESNTASTSYTIAGKWDSGEEGYLLSQYGDEIRMYINSASIYAETNSANLATGSWYHVAGVYNAVTQTIKIYINGEEAASTTTGTVPSSITNTGGAFAIGAVNTLTTPANFYDGVIDEVRVYNQALSKSDIANLYTWTPSPVSYWKFDENSGSTAYNSSTNDLVLEYSASSAAPTALADGSNGQSCAQTITTSSVSPTVGKKLLIMAFGQRNNHTSAYVWGITASAGDTPSTASTTSTFNWDTLNTFAGSGVLFELSVASAGSRTFTIDGRTSGTQTFCYSYLILEVDDASYVQAIVADGASLGGGNSESDSIALGSNPTSGNYVIVMAGKGNDATSALSVPTDYNTLVNQTQTYTSVGAFYRNDTTSPTASFTDLGQSVGNWGGFILELSPAVPLPLVWSTGKFGGGLQMAGGTDVVTVAESAPVDLGTTTDSYSVSSWIKTTTNGSGTAAILAKNDGSGAYPYHLYLNSSEQACFQISDGTNSPSVCGSTALNDGAWHHLTGVRDVVSDTLYLYVDGVLVNSTTDTTTATTANDDNLSIGNSGTSYTANDFTGYIDELKIYNFARTTKQVVEDMNAGHPTGGSPISSMVGYWKLDEQGGQTANNSGFGTSISGTLGASGSPSTDDPTWKIPGSTTCKINGCSSFDGGDFINITDSTSVRPSPITISAWVNLNVNSSDYTIINKQYGTSTNTSYLFTFNSGVLQFSVCDSGATCVTAGDLSGALPTGQWTHVAGTYDGSTAKLYKNGSLIREAVGTVTIAYDTNPVFIGARNLDASPTSPNFGFMNGYLDEIKMYNSALTADEIKIDYNAGSAAAFGGVLGTQDNEGFGGNAPLVHWPFDENTGTSTTLDKSGNENAGTLTSIVSSSWIPGKFGSGLTLDGTADYIGNTDLATSLTGDLTVGVWFKTATLPGTQSRILDLAQASTLGLQLSMVSDGRVGLDNTGGPTTGCFTTGTYHDNKWHFMQVTRSGTTYTVYLDGGVETCTDTGTAPTYDDLYVGRQSPGAGTSFFAGSVDEVKVYNYVRSAAQRAYDHNRGAPLAWYKLDECQNAVAYNSAPAADGEAAGLDGTITPGASGNTAVGTCNSGTSTEMWDDGTIGKRNASLGFDGIDDYVEIADNAILRPENGSWTVMAWAKPPDSNGSYSIIHKRQNSGDFEQWGLILNNQLLEGDFRESETVERVATTTADVADGNWHHYVMVADKSFNNIKLYVDGIEKTATRTTDGSWPTVNNTDVLRIGEANGCCNFSGLIDDVRIYNYAASESQIKKVYNNGAVFFGPSEGSP